MNKAAFVLAVAEATDEDIELTTRMVDAMLKVMIHTVAGGEAVRVSGWGTLEPVIRPERTSRNPQTGERITVPDKLVVKFSVADRFAAYTNEELPLPARAADVQLKAPKTLALVPAPQAAEQGAP